MKYVCDVCGYVYDEEAEGVKFDDLPEDWVCPLCGVGKDQFSKDEQSKSPTNKQGALITVRLCLYKKAGLSFMPC